MFLELLTNHYWKIYTPNVKDMFLVYSIAKCLSFELYDDQV